MYNSEKHSSIHGLIFQEFSCFLRWEQVRDETGNFDFFLDSTVTCKLSFSVRIHNKLTVYLFIYSLLIYAFHKSDYRKLNDEMGSGQIW